MWIPLLVMMGVGAAGYPWWSIFVAAGIWLVGSAAISLGMVGPDQFFSFYKLAVAITMYLIICAGGYWIGRGLRRLFSARAV
jgi:hypothetical protein